MTTFIVAGDLHYEERHRDEYVRATERFRTLRPDAVIQLGDQGAYGHCGTPLSFREGRAFLDGLETPWHTVLGNHDLESREFSTDDASIGAWMEAMGCDTPYRSAAVGELLVVCLSTTAFRSNRGFAHEVFVDPAQTEWFRRTLAEHRGRRTVVVTHAPIIGSRLPILVHPHLSAPNAWVNHSQQPGQFIEIVRANPQIVMWFSAHNHLGQDYTDAIVTLGTCSFVHTGVMGRHVTRDGSVHSRLAACDDDGFTIYTIDHAGGATREDLRRRWSGETLYRRSFPPGADSERLAPPAYPDGAGDPNNGGHLLLRHDGHLLAFHAPTRAPIAVVRSKLGDAPYRVDGDRVLVHGPEGAETYVRAPSGLYARV